MAGMEIKVRVRDWKREGGWRDCDKDRYTHTHTHTHTQGGGGGGGGSASSVTCPPRPSWLQMLPT